MLYRDVGLFETEPHDLYDLRLIYSNARIVGSKSFPKTTSNVTIERIGSLSRRLPQRGRGLSRNLHRTWRCRGGACAVALEILRLLQSRFGKAYPAAVPALQPKHLRSKVALFAAVSGPERMRCGTGATTRFALKLRRPVMLVHADGQVTHENDTTRLLKNAPATVTQSKGLRTGAGRRDGGRRRSV